MLWRWVAGRVFIGWMALFNAGVFAQEAMKRSPIDNFPVGERGQLIRLGFDLVMKTKMLAPAFAKSGLNCTHCHLDGGRTIGAASFIGLSLVYPEYRARNARVNTLEDRLDDCFERSLNGKPLPAGTREKEALLAYIAWLSERVSKESALGWRGFPRVVITKPPDAIRGRALFDTTCAVCHGPDGQGTAMAPPVWGPHSYNIGAGMARVGVAAAFIKKNMPPAQGGTLTDEEAYDVAAFINAQPRPDFPGKIHDWPKGDKPADAPY